MYSRYMYIVHTNTSIDIITCRLSTPTDAFDGATQLNNIYLSGMDLTEISASTFKLSNEFNHLSINDNHLSVIEPGAFVLPPVTGESR